MSEKQYDVNFPVTLVVPPDVLNIILGALEELPMPSRVYKKVMGTIQPQVLQQAKDFHEQRSSQAGPPQVGGERPTGETLGTLPR